MSDIRQLNREDIIARLSEAEQSMTELRFQLGMQQLDNPLRVGRLRKDIARLRTVLREMDLGIQKEK